MGSTLDIKFDVEKLRKKLVISESQIDELGNEILIALADRFLELIKEKAPRKTGKYADAWTRKDPKDGFIEITNPDGLLYNVLEFTGRRQLHVTPNKAKVLHFVIDGKDIFVKCSLKSYAPPLVPLTRQMKLCAMSTRRGSHPPEYGHIGPARRLPGSRTGG